MIDEIVKKYLGESKKDTLGDKFNKMFWWDKDFSDPKKVRDNVRKMSDEDLINLSGGEDEKTLKKTPRDLQIKIIKQEIKRRGL